MAAVPGGAPSEGAWLLSAYFTLAGTGWYWLGHINNVDGRLGSSHIGMLYALPLFTATFTLTLSRFISVCPAGPLSLSPSSQYNVDKFLFSTQPCRPGGWCNSKEGVLCCAVLVYNTAR